MNWNITQSGFDKDSFADNGNRFLVGNGYMGVRGTLEEHTKDQLVAVNLAGIYDKVGNGWREPLNAPNPFYTYATAGGTQLRLPQLAPVAHFQMLDYRSGVASRRTLWQLPDGQVELHAARFASMDDKHLLGMRYALCADTDMTLQLFAGIDADVWDIHGPHYTEVEFLRQSDTLVCAASVQQQRDTVAVCRRDFIASEGTAEQTALQAGQTYTLRLKANEETVLFSLCSVYTTHDTNQPAEAALAALQGFTAQSYETLLQASSRQWEEIWRCGQVEIEGDENAEQAVNYSLYHLNCIAPRGGEALSIAARGLSGQTYKGAVFWDSEVFILDYFLATQPEVARSLVRYRIDTLPGAMDKAAEYGWQGAFYAWESQEDGFDACSDYNVTDVFTGRPVRTYFRDKQVHISSAVVWAIQHYLHYTGDDALLAEGAARVILECARFYWSMLLHPLPAQRYELHDVIGPDEYHERVNNNAYTNRMAMYVFNAALETAAKMQASFPAAWQALEQTAGATALVENIRDAKARFYVPAPGENGLIEQFDGYFALEDASLETVRSRLKDEREYWGGGNGVASDTQIIKQADVVAMLEMFHADYPADILRQNWEYYEPRTEHGSSLSACMYAMLACRFARPDLAYPFFMKSATAEIRGGGKQWAGLVYIGGTHPAAAGGAWKTLAQGFAGLHLDKDGNPALSPCLPEAWQTLRFRFVHGGKLLCAQLTHDSAEILAL